MNHVLSSSESSLATELFVRTADENYVTARWACIAGMHLDFLWLALHALEKYLKSTLLFNGRSAQGYSHELPKMYRDVQGFAGDLLPVALVKPCDLDTPVWFDRTVEQFIDWLYSNGNAENRYGTYGYNTRSQDLHDLDTIVYAIRRLICPLDEPIFRLPRASLPTYREHLKSDASYRPRLGTTLDELLNGRGTKQARQAALNLNLAFAPTTYAHRAMRSFSAGRNPVLLRRIFEPLKSTNRAVVEEGLATADWLLANVQVPGSRGKRFFGVAKELQDAMDAARVGLLAP